MIIDGVVTINVTELELEAGESLDFVINYTVSDGINPPVMGELDVTVVSPDAMLSTFDDILQALTLGIAGIAAISLVVAGILVMNVTLMSVKQRTAEIGLLKAIGAPAAQVRTLFLSEAGLIAAMGALIGMATGHAVVLAARQLYPDVPFSTPGWALWAAFLLAVGTALVFAWLPAQRAANLEPVDALGKK